MLEKLGGHIGKRLDPDRIVGPVYKQGSRGRWRWMAYYLPTGERKIPDTVEEARERKLKIACVGPIWGYDTKEEAIAAVKDLLNVWDE